MEAPTYPATPVDCLISELRDLFESNGWTPSKTKVITLRQFEERVQQFKTEVAAERWNAHLSARAEERQSA